MASLKYLLVDDSPVVRLTLKQGLQQEHVDPSVIWEASTASQAIEMFDQVTPDVVFLDVSIPAGKSLDRGPAGYLDFLAVNPPGPGDPESVVRHMAQRNPRVKFVVCTGNPPDDPRVRELVKAGAFRLLQKPIHLAQIHAVVAELRSEMG